MLDCLIKALHESTATWQVNEAVIQATWQVAAALKAATAVAATVVMIDKMVAAVKMQFMLCTISLFLSLTF